MQLIRNLLHGAVIGVANIIPGVSGGTLALVLGIYERLIAAIHNISLETVKTLLGIFRFNRASLVRLKTELRRIDAVFLATIAVGALTAIVALAELMTYLLKNWHDPTYGFFFGLVLISAVAPYKLIRKISIRSLVSVILAVALVVAISYAVSGEKLIEKARVKHELSVQKETDAQNRTDPEDTKSLDPFHLLYIAFLGAVGISAMILPGVSGAFLLLVMGGYFDILQAIAVRDIPVLAVFLIGSLVGILAFTRLLNFLLKRFHDETMSFLLGLVIGSLWMIWPFKTTAVIGEGTIHQETIYLANRLPESFGVNEVFTLIAFLAGASIVAVMVWAESRRNNKEG